MVVPRSGGVTKCSGSRTVLGHVMSLLDEFGTCGPWQDGVQERDRLVPGTLRWFSLDVSAQRAWAIVRPIQATWQNIYLQCWNDFYSLSKSGSAYIHQSRSSGRGPESMFRVLCRSNMPRVCLRIHLPMEIPTKGCAQDETGSRLQDFNMQRSDTIMFMKFPR